MVGHCSKGSVPQAYVFLEGLRAWGLNTLQLQGPQRISIACSNLHRSDHSLGVNRCYTIDYKPKQYDKALSDLYKFSIDGMKCYKLTLYWVAFWLSKLSGFAIQA